MSIGIEQAAAKARTVWLREYLEHQLNSLFSPDADYNYWFNNLLSTMEQRGLTSPTQQKDYLTDVRNAISAIDPNHPSLDVVKFDKSTWTEINNYNSDRIAERTTKFLSDPDAIVKRATVLLGSYQWSEIAAGLAVVTGRRCTEVIKTASFQKQSDYSVIFRGSLKRRNEPIECVFEIPTLCPADSIINGISSLRKQLGREIESLSPRQVASRYGRGVAKVCDRTFSDLVPARDDKDNLYTHLFRAIYATIAAYWYCPPAVPEMEFRASIQGHYQILDEQNPQLRRSLAASRNYFDYKIADGSGNIDGRLGIKLNLPDVEVIKEWKHLYSPKIGKEEAISSDGVHLRSGIPRDKPRPSRTGTTPHKDNSKDAIVSPHKTIASDVPNNQVISDNQKPKRAISTPKKTSVSSSHIMNNSSSLSIPSFLLSDLDAIAQELGLSHQETIHALFTWTKMGLSLARQLELDDSNPEAVFNAVQEMQQHGSKNAPSNHDVSNLDTQKLLDLSLSLAHSIERLSFTTTEVPSQKSPNVKSTPRNSFTSNTVASSDLERTASRISQRSLYSSTHSESSSSNTENGKDNSIASSTSDRTEKKKEADSSSLPTDSVKVIKRDNSATVRKDIDHAIDAMMEFNDADRRPHQQKFYIGIGSVRELCGRGDKAIRNALDERESEIESHLQQHELSLTHNYSRKDDNGNPYPDIADEPELHYHKITLVTDHS